METEYVIDNLLGCEQYFHHQKQIRGAVVEVRW